MALMINGERVENEEIQAAAQQLGAHPDDAIEADRTARDMVIARILVRQEVQRRQIPIHNAEVNRRMSALKEEHGGDDGFHQFLEQAKLKEADIRKEIELQVKIDRLLDEVCESVTAPTEEDVQAYYDANPDLFAIPERVHAAHIVKHGQGNVLEMHQAAEEIRDVYQQLQNGASFEDLARQHSDCPENAGDLGVFPRGEMVQEFEDVVFAMKEGEVSEVFQSPFGFHIAKVFERYPAQAQPLEDVADHVKQTLQEQWENAAIDAFTDELRKTASIEEVE